MHKITKVPKLTPSDSVPVFLTEKDNILSAFWYMLKEMESKADCDSDALNKHIVGNYYKLWNRVTGDNKEPIWVERLKG